MLTIKFKKWISHKKIRKNAPTLINQQVLSTTKQQNTDINYFMVSGVFPEDRDSCAIHKLLSGTSHVPDCSTTS